MKQPIKPKTYPCDGGGFPPHHYINTNKKYRKYKRYFFVISWFTHAIEQMDKPTAPIKAVQSMDYYRQ